MAFTQNNFFFKTKIKLVQKICLAGIFTALAIILQKVVAINYIAVVPFLRISFGGCAMIMLSSILLGPIYGLAVGGLSDVLGYFIFDPKTTGAFFPTITLIYCLLGFATYFVFCLIRYLKNNKVCAIIEYATFFALWLFVTLFVVLSKEMVLYGQTYTFEMWQKICIPIITFALLAVLVVANYFINRHLSKKNLPFSVYQVSFISFIVEIVVLLLFGSLMKGIAFGMNMFLAIFVCQALVSFVNIIINTVIISYALLLTKRYYN